RRWVLATSCVRSEARQRWGWCPRAAICAETPTRKSMAGRRETPMAWAHLGFYPAGHTKRSNRGLQHQAACGRCRALHETQAIRLSRCAGLGEDILQVSSDCGLADAKHVSCFLAAQALRQG